MRTDKEIDELMDKLPPRWCRRWCTAYECGCMGCVNGSGFAYTGKMERAEWEDWMRRHPEPNGEKTKAEL